MQELENSLYWRVRWAQTQERLTTKSIKETEKQLTKYYANSMQKILGQFEATYLKLLSTIGEDKLPTPADLYKLGKYWELQNFLKEELTRLGDKQAALLSKKFVDQYLAVYEGIALKGEASFRQMNRETAMQMINQIWCADGESWSKRIWKNTDKLQQALNDNLIHCVLTGKKSSELKASLQNDFNVSYYRANTIVRTEMAHIQTQAAQQRYTDYGITEVQVWADKDERRCPECGRLHKKKFPIGGQMPVPVHPNCRCAIIPVID
jgi:SPP1 gp7 family putative phage head morphogenesis protein